MSDTRPSTRRAPRSDIVTSRGRDLAEAADRLAAWLGARLAPAKVIGVDDLRYPFGAGASNETILLRAVIDDDGLQTSRRLVLRVSPAPEDQLFLDVHFKAQYQLLATLGERRLVRVPPVVWFEEDPSWFGRPFFIMEQMDGRVPVTSPNYNRQGWLFDAEPVQRRVLWESAVRQLGRIHSVPLEAVSFLNFDPAQSGFQQALRYAQDHYAWACAGQCYPSVERLYQWVFANLPDTPGDGLSWGDARIGNMMFGDDFEVVGVMDWEQAGLAGPWLDLAWWLFRDDTESVMAGLPRLDGLGTRQETITLWEEVVGISVPDLLWYEVFTGLRHATLTIRSAHLRGVPAGPDNPFVRLAYRRLGWGEPT